MATVFETNISEYPLKARGKVRDIYDLGDQLLFIATDRLSAFDYVLPTPIEDKGKVLTQISLFWFEFLKGVCQNHVITADFNQYPEPLKKHPEIAGRSMIVKKADMFPVECVARGYLSGSGLKEYQETKSVCKIPFHRALLIPAVYRKRSLRLRQNLKPVMILISDLNRSWKLLVVRPRLTFAN